MSDLIKQAVFKKQIEERVQRPWYSRDKHLPKYWKNKSTEQDGVIHTTAGVVKTVDNNIHMKPQQQRRH